MSEPRDFPVSWEEIHRDTKALAWKLEGREPEGSWKGLIGITRGGLVPACIVARELGIYHVETFCIASYEEKAAGQADIQREEHSIFRIPENAGDGEGWLVVDDLADTGKTFKIVREILPKAHYACIYAKPAGADTADTFVTGVSQDTWIHFPWELPPKDE